jgi:hypothetical protein
VNDGSRIENVRANKEREREREREIRQRERRGGLVLRDSSEDHLIFLHTKGKGKSAELWALFGQN